MVQTLDEGVERVQQCSSEQCAVCGALRMRTMRDVDVSTIGMKYKLHVHHHRQLWRASLPLPCHLPKHSCTASVAICLSGIGQDIRGRPLSAERHIFCQYFIDASVYHHASCRQFCCAIGPSCSADVPCHVLRVAYCSHDRPRAVKSNRISNGAAQRENDCLAAERRFPPSGPAKARQTHQRRRFTG